MNYRYVANQLGNLLIVFSVAMAALVALAWLLDAGQGRDVNVRAVEALLSASVLCVIVGGLSRFLTRRSGRFLGRREAMLLVSLSWILGALFAGLPFLIWAQLFWSGDGAHPFQSPVNCYFEAMSGLTTTGATVLTDIESLPRELLLWRSFTHWIGGLGIVVLFVAVLPTLGVGGKMLYRVEAPGPAPQGLQPQIRDTARILWLIYAGLTVLETLALWGIARMNLFDAVCHTFSTLATGGLSTRNASLGAYYDQKVVDIIVIVFMVIAGANFALYYQIWRGKWATVLRDTELRLYCIAIFIGTVIVTAALMRAGDPLVLTTGDTVEPTFMESARNAAFTTISIQTTTGFCTTDFDRWPFIAKAVLITLMFVGGCSGSTAGGIKVIRIWIAIKVMLVQTEAVFRPGVIRPIRVSGAIVDRELQLATVAYVLSVIILFGLGWCGIMLLEDGYADGCSPATAATASVATLCTVGPGLDGVGAVQNYGWFSAPSKLLLCVLMALGRLEIFAILVLFRPGFWERR